MTQDGASWAQRAGIILACVVTGVGCWLVLANIRSLPMLDAPNHIASATIAEGLLNGDTFFHEHYSLSPRPVPYWATTLGILALRPWFDPTEAFGVIVIVYLLAMPAAFIFLALVAAPENTALAVVPALGAFGAIYWLGESNFLLSQPFFVASFAFFLRVNRLRSWAFAGFVTTVALTYLSHIYGIVALAVSIGALFCVALPRRSPWAEYRPGLAQWLGAAVALHALALGAWMVFFDGSDPANRGRLLLEAPALWRAAAVAYNAFASPLYESITPTRLLGVVLIACCILPSLRIHRERYRPELRRAFVNPVFPPAMALLALTMFGPAGLESTQGRDAEDFVLRFSTLAFLILPLAFRLPRGQWSTLLGLAALIPFCAWRLSEVRQLHEQHSDREAELVQRLIDPIPERSRVLGLWVIPDGESPRGDDRFRHLVDHVVIRRHGYSSGVFAAPGQQALRHRRWGSHLPDLRMELEAPEWNSFDFVLLYSRGVPVDDGALAARSRLVVTMGGFRIYNLRASMLAAPGTR